MNELDKKIREALREEDAEIFEDFGGEPSMLLILRDTTSRRMLETKLRQSQKLESVGTLAAGIAHDFNNILQAILGYSVLYSFRICGKRKEQTDIPPPTRRVPFPTCPFCETSSTASSISRKMR